jgi:hypothetical protein
MEAQACQIRLFDIVKVGAPPVAIARSRKVDTGFRTERAIKDKLEPVF